MTYPREENNASGPVSDQRTDSDVRFGFGRNWRNYSRTVDASALSEMQESIRETLPDTDLRDYRVLDVGCGSGLASAAFSRFGANVRAFDFDPDSVLCSGNLRSQLDVGENSWTVDQGSVLDPEFLRSLGEFDLVYAWGVLHHTGSLWVACENVSKLVRPGGQLIVAIYNDQKLISKYWKAVKYLYNVSPVLRPVIIALHFPYLIGARYLVRLLKGRRLIGRGMRLWYDMIDWLGGYPFEVASPEDVLKFFDERGFALEGKTLCGSRHGCNEFVFRKSGDELPS